MTYDVTKNIGAYEDGELDDGSVNELFQYLVDTDQVWKMEAKYGKRAVELAGGDALRFPTLD